MKKYSQKIISSLSIIILAGYVFGLQGKLSYANSQSDDLLNEYEYIINKYISDSEKIKSDPVELNKRMRELNAEIAQWSKKWDAMAGKIKPAEMAKIRERLNQLSQKLVELYNIKSK